MSAVVQIENLSKIYRLGEIGTGTISHDLNRWFAKVRGKEDPFLKIGESSNETVSENKLVYSLRNINLTIEQGDTIGVIGKNGAGKSTLLKILSQVTSPTTGKIKIKGRIASLLEVGTGFHPELTGRENIYLNGAILGMRKAEINRKLEEIIEFSGIARYIDTPVKRYSSGMYVRLAFAVAAHLESEILIVDEVLAVGDAEFQKKCLGKIGDISRGEGRTVLFVSHNMASIEALCKKGVYLKNGRLEYEGDIKNTVSRYLNQRIDNSTTDLKDRTDREGFGNILITKVVFKNDGMLQTGDDLVCEAFYECVNDSTDLSVTEFGLSVWTDRDVRLISLSTDFSSGLDFKKLGKSGSVTCTIKSIPLVEGNYILNFFVSSGHGIEDYILNCLSFSVEQTDYFKSGKTVDPVWGAIAVNHEWNLNN